MWRNRETSYGLISIVLHWTVAALFLGQIPLGFLTQATGSRPALQFELYQWHKSIGFLVLAISVPRLAWALFSVTPRAPSSLTIWEKRAARAGHIVLYALTVLVPLAGWAIASASPLRIPSYAFNLVLIPNLPLGVSDAAEALWSSVHTYLAYAGGCLAVIHIAAALRHHFWLRDDTLKRMVLISAER